MAMQGFPIPDQKVSFAEQDEDDDDAGKDSWTHSQMSDMAGNAFNGFVLGALLTAALPLVPWQQVRQLGVADNAAASVCMDEEDEDEKKSHSDESDTDSFDDILVDSTDM